MLNDEVAHNAENSVIEDTQAEHLADKTCSPFQPLRRLHQVLAKDKPGTGVGTQHLITAEVGQSIWHRLRAYLAHSPPFKGLGLPRLPSAPGLLQVTGV